MTTTLLAVIVGYATVSFVLLRTNPKVGRIATYSLYVSLILTTAIVINELTLQADSVLIIVQPMIIALLLITAVAILRQPQVQEKPSPGVREDRS